MAAHDRIVVGGDTTPAASAALLWAVGEAASRDGCDVLVVHAFDTAGRADLALERDLDRARRDARYRTQSWVVEVLGDSLVSVPVSVQTPDATVEDALAAASAHASMVVVGVPQTGRRQGLVPVLKGRCRCPVVTIGTGRSPAAPDEDGPGQALVPLRSAGSTLSP